MKRWSEGISKVTFGRVMGSGPAAVHRRSGVIILNPDIWERLTVDQKYFILLHEWAHIDLKSSDEVLVDEHAFKEYAKRGYRLSQAVKSLTRILPFKTGEHYERANRMLKRAIEFDRKHNNHKVSIR